MHIFMFCVISYLYNLSHFSLITMKFLHIPRQHCCRGMCKISLCSDQSSLNYVLDFSQIYSQNTSHSLPVRESYGLSATGSTPDLCFTLVIVLPHATMCDIVTCNLGVPDLPICYYHLIRMTGYQDRWPNNGCQATWAIGIWEWIDNLILHFIMDVIDYPCWDLS